MWVTIDVERALYVQRGRDTILCSDREQPGALTLVVSLSEQARRKLLEELKRT